MTAYSYANYANDTIDSKNLFDLIDIIFNENKIEDTFIFEDANTEKSNKIEIDENGEFEGIFIDKQYENLDSKEVEITFIFSKSPTAYIDYCDTLNNVIIIEFYGAIIGNSLIENISEYPIIRYKTTQIKYDLNKDVEGFKADIRDVVRMKLYSEMLFPYKMLLDDFNNIVLKFKWNKKIEKKIKKKNTKGYIKNFNLISTVVIISFAIFMAINAKISN